MALNEFYLKERESWRKSFLKAIVISVTIILTLLITLRFFRDFSFHAPDLVLFGIILVYLILYYVSRRGFLTPASVILVLINLIAVCFLAFRSGGILDSSVFAYMAVIVISYLLLGWRFSLFVLAASILWLWFMGWLALKGYRTFDNLDSITDYLRDFSFMIILVAVLSNIYLNRMEMYIQRLSNELAERKKAESTLRESEENYRYLFEQASEGILIGNPQGEILLSNEGMNKITGYDAEELCGMNLSSLFPAEELKKSPLRYDLVQKDETVIRERKLLHKDGSLVPVEMRTKRLNDGRLQSFFSDISRRLLAEKSLRDFKRIFNLSANPICIVDESGILTRVNPAFVRLMGYEEEEIVGCHITNFIHPDDVEKTDSYMMDMVANQAEIICYENRYLTKSGKEIWFSWITQPIYSEKLSFSIAHDITHLKAVEQELVKAKEKAEESDRLKTAFLENMSHEIRTPMNGILGFSEMLADDTIDPEQKKHYIGLILDSGEKLLTIVNDILDISAIETGQLEISEEPVDVAGLMSEVYNLFLQRVKASGLEFYLKEKAGSDITILSDKNRLHQILGNLVSNAIKFTVKGYIELRYELQDKYIRFSVEDTGIGIEPEMQELIFERFRQAEVNHSRDHGGTGLGLSISQRLVEMLGGELRLESKPGKGSTFSFTIPAVPAINEVHPESELVAGTNIQINPDNACILIAEDDDTNYEYIYEILSKNGFRTKRAVNGLEAVNMALADKSISLVLMDMKMPELDGYAATRQIKKARKSLPVIAQTAYAMAKDQVKAEEAGCDAYLAKPVTIDNLLGLLAEFLK